MAEELLRFWRTELLGKPPLLLLPTDKPRTSTASSLFQVPFSLPEEQVGKLAAIGRQACLSVFPGEKVDRKCELSWAALAAFQVLLARYSRQDDITIGTPKLAGGPELLPLRVDLEKNPTFADLVTLNASKAAAICRHSEVSVVQLAQAVGADNFDFSLGLHPVFQAAFLLDGSDEACRLSQGFNLDVFLEFKEVNGMLEGQLCGKETFFSVPTMERMAKHFKNLVVSIVELSDRPISQLDFVDAAERETVLKTFNATGRGLPPPHAGTTIHGLFEHYATATPDARAISFEGEYLTYRQLDERANQLARFLEANGVKDEQPVGVMLERSLELMVAMMGVLKAGGAFVPMDPEYPADRLAIMAEDAEVPVLLSLSRIDAYVPLPPTAQRVNLDTDWAKIATFPGKRPSKSRSHPNGLAYIIFTSGSTGRPKGTLLQHSGLINYLYYLTSEHDLGSKDIFLQKTPISFDVSVRELFFPFSVGAELVFAVPGGHRDTQYLAELIAAQGITCCSFVPSQLEVFLQEVDGSACRALRRVFVSGEALPPTSVAKFLEQLPQAQLHNLYGPTEATVDVTGYDVRLHKGRATVPIGYPIANVKMYVLDTQLRPLPVGVPGELMISSLQLARGYIKRPDLTAEKFIDCPFGTGDYGKMYRTGDLARWLPEGVIEFLGRLDHQVKLRGFRIELGEIENGLCNCPGIRQAVVVVVKDHAGNSHLVAYVTPEVVDIPAAVRELSQNVPEYMVPEIIMPLKELPTLPNGKVNRRGLPEPDFSITAQHDYAAPRNDIEEEIQDAWHEVFQMQPISVDADFFRIGGNSLLAGKVISRLRLAFAVELPFTSIFQQRTIGDMALFIQSKLQQQPATFSSNPAAALEEINIPVFYGEKERCASTPCSYSQELLLFNNELDPFNPVHNEAAWVRVHGDLDVGALVRALRYLVDRHTVLSSHIALAGVKGPMLKQTRPAKFKLPVSYVDLLTGDELQVPEIMQRANSLKRVSLPSKIVKRRARLKTLKTANASLAQSMRERESSSFTAVAPRQISQLDAAHITLPSAATRNLAVQVEQLQASNSPESAEALQRLRTWLRSGNVAQESFTGINPDAALDNRTPSNTSSHSSHDALVQRGSDPKMANGEGEAALLSVQEVGKYEADLPPLRTVSETDRKRRSSGLSSGLSSNTAADAKPLLQQHHSNSNGAYAPPYEQQVQSRTASIISRTNSATLEASKRPPVQRKEKARGCLNLRKDPIESEHSLPSARMASFKGKPMEIEQSNETVKEVEAIAWRVKKSLLLHWLTCGIYSTRQSGGTQGFWKSIRENVASFAGYPEPETSRPLDDDLEDEGGIMIPELASKKSVPSTTLRDLLLHEAAQPFKIMQGPLLRIKLIRVDSEEHVLLITMHHSVTDGWSTGIIWRELSAAYNAFHRGKVSVGLPPLPIQYADFATWQRRWLAQGAMSQQMKFWRRHLEGARAQWDFPTDFFRPAVPSGNSARVPIAIKHDAVKSMKKLSSQVNATMFMALLAAYNVLMARYSNEEDLVCGLPYAGRSRAETEGLIGAFLGAVALRVDLSGNPSFRQVMQRVRKCALEVFENADVPLHLVMVDILGLNNVGGCGAPPLFQNMFFLHDSSWLEGLSLDNLSVELPAKVEKNVARFDLTLEMTIDATKDEVSGHIEYRTDLFKRSTIEALVKHFEVLLDSIIAKPDASVWDLPMLTPEEIGVLEGVRGVPSYLTPSGSSAKHAKPKVLSHKGYQMPLGIPGNLHITYNTDRRQSLTNKDIRALRTGSLMHIISGGFKKLFEDDKDKEKRQSIEYEGSTKAGSSHPAVYEVASLSPRAARPISPFVAPPEPEPSSSVQHSPSKEYLADAASLSTAPKRSLRALSEEIGSVEHTIDTGLLARISRDGKLEIIGRASNKVDVAGVSVQLEDIDRQIETIFPQVEKAAAVLLTDPQGVERLVAYVSPAEVNVRQLENNLRDHVSNIHVPYLFQPLRRLPTTSHGEVDRAALPPLDWSLKVPRPYKPPQSRLEMEVQLIWKAVLNKKDMISCDADFSEIGGNMMHAVIANGIVREALGVQMPAINIFRDRTIANVSERIKQLRRRGRSKSMGGAPKRSASSSAYDDIAL